jgi:UDP-2-acetamido-3-amino-2,3-dideoxy-glucuronate N-acetyltransferase
MPTIHPSADVSDTAVISEGTRIWAAVQVRDGARVGRNCIVGKGAFIDVDVTIGDHVKVQNNASLYAGLEVEDGVFIGPHVVFTNDKVPRAINPDGSLKSPDDWHVGRTQVRYGAAVGACAVVVTGIEIGRWAMVGSGAVVTKDVPDHALVVGSPARIVGYVSATGRQYATQAEAQAQTVREQEGCA